MIEVSAEGGLWRVVLNRPEKANALTREMLVALAEAARAAAADPDARTFVLTGAGERVFCAGADMESTDDMQAFTRDRAWRDASAAIAALPCLSIAALNGTLAGGGFCPALACDLRIATPGAKFFYPVLKRGFLPQPDDVLRLARLVGPSRARLILMGGQRIDAAEALAWGLVDRVAELTEFPALIDALTADARAASRAQLAAIKALFLAPRGDALNDCYRAAYGGEAEALARLQAFLAGAEEAPPQ